MRWVVSGLLCCGVAVGCGRAVPLGMSAVAGVPSQHVGPVVPLELALTVGSGATREVLPVADGLPAFRVGPTDPVADLYGALRREQAGGLIRYPEGEVGESGSPARTVQVQPKHSQERASAVARAWHRDARQVYVAWGFKGLKSLSEVQHVHYSPAVRRSLVQAFRLQPWISRNHEEISRRMDRGSPFLQGVQDDFGIDAHEAYAIARRAGYSGDGLAKAAVLIRPLVIGPVWAFLDGLETQMTVIAIDAISGEVIRAGLKLEVIRYIVEPVPEEPPIILPSPAPPPENPGDDS
ncbi:MAG: hypothetical protein VKO64_00600 [Candidatus Sericytochromatia bacterium]|nr:hypothetical protein [Candidatus Sericytochromatia bacterium]